MRIARVLGCVTLSRRLANLQSGRLTLVEALDASALEGRDNHAARATPMPESLVAFDPLSAKEGSLVAISEGREAAVPFDPQRMPIDAYVAAILDTVNFEPMKDV